MTNSARLAEVLEVLGRLYPAATAEPWDAVGLVCGDPDDPVESVVFAIDPLPPVVAEAVRRRAQLLVTHHPLFLRPVHSVAATGWKGRAIHDLVRSGCALYTAHTNADVAVDGVNEALAGTLGLTGCRPLDPSVGEPTDKIVTYVPEGHVDQVRKAMTSAGAGTIGNYSGCAWSVVGEGTFRPGEGAQPMIGVPGRVEHTPEARLEMIAPRARRMHVVRAMIDAHPYEEVAFDVLERVSLLPAAGLGRVGRLAAPTTVGEFARHVADRLPATPAGVAVMGDPAMPVETVAVCGGAGDSMLDAATRAGADVVVTADVRHHPASEHLAAGGPALIDPGHWASEWPWLRWAADRLSDELAHLGTTVDTHVSQIVTEPVTWVVGAERSAAATRREKP